MAEGFAFIEAHLSREGRPLAALAGCELRSPASMTVAEFQAFNGQYLKTLQAWGCRLGEINTLARSNIAPITEVPSESSFFAFTYTVPERDAAGDFLISGKPENRDGVTGPERIFGGRDVSLRGLEAKARFVMNTLHERVTALNCDWSGAYCGAGLHRARHKTSSRRYFCGISIEPNWRCYVSGMAAS
jgi:hypothetical protein